MKPLDLNCPICKKDTDFENTTLNYSGIKEYYKINENSLTLKKIKEDKMDWFCLECLGRENILIANWKKQNLRGYLCFEWIPIIYYRPTLINCKICKNAFNFSAQEQKVWYEEYKIFTDVKPKLCLPCRRKSKVIKKINEELSPLLKEVTTKPTKEKLVRISELYIELGNKRKAGIYLAKLKSFF